MSDEKKNNYPDATSPALELAPPRFDEVASAKAQPVKPLPARGFGVSFPRTHSVLAPLKIRNKAMALLLVAGMAMGALGGTLLVRQRQSGSEAPALSETAARTGTLEAGVDGSRGGESLDALANALQNSAKRTSEMRSRQGRRHRVQSQPQAYRVGVIK
ncbi:MAG: hypothetical protein QOJ88_604 [Pyrinomonadaceae bacterium]|jgi:hypothetical protein|nr:hypothetical protein [Pyrinomonadaceae bacterium]